MLLLTEIISQFIPRFVLERLLKVGMSQNLQYYVHRLSQEEGLVFREAIALAIVRKIDVL